MSTASSSSKPAQQSPSNPPPEPAQAVNAKIGDLKPGMKNLTIVFIALEKGSTTYTKDGNYVVQYLVADSSGSIWVSLWDDKAEAMQPGDIFCLRNGYTTIYKTSMMLYASRVGILERLGEFTMVFSETPNLSNYEWVLDAKDPSGYARIEPRVASGPRPLMPTNR